MILFFLDFNSEHTFTTAVYFRYFGITKAVIFLLAERRTLLAKTIK